MKKTLIICQFYPLPEVAGGCIRTMHFVRFFKKLGKVDIAYPHETCNVKIADSVFSSEYRLGNTEYPTHKAGRLGAVLRGRPYPIRSYNRKAKKLFLKAIRSNNYDYILVRYIVNTYDLLGLEGKIRKRTILDFDDLYSNSLYDSLFYETKSPIKRFLRYFNKKLLSRYEKRCIDLNISIFCSEKDRTKYVKNGIKSFVVPNIYSNKSFESYEFGNGFNNQNVLLFVGMLSYEPNFNGLKWFIESIYPKVKEKHKDVKLWVVGHLWDSSDVQIKMLCRKGKDIDLYTNVEDIKEFYKKARIVVVPILTGGGTRIKILEAALAKRPVLSTSVGAEGLGMENGRHLMIFDNADEFLFKFDEMAKRENYSTLTNSASLLVSKEFSEKIFEARMEKVLDEIDRH